MPSGTVRPAVGQSLKGLAFSLSLSLEGRNVHGTNPNSLSRWNVEGQSVDFGRRWGMNMTHVRCAGRYEIVGEKS